MLTWTKYQLCLVLLMIITGVFNTLSLRWADTTKAIGTDGELRYFNHRFFEAIIMFAGEMVCIVIYKITYYHFRRKRRHHVNVFVKGNRDFNSWIFFLPAACDVIATSVMFVGLRLTYSASHQMLKGSLIMFVATLSIGFLGRKISPAEWIGMFLVVSGLFVVGISDFMIQYEMDYEGRDVLVGDLLIVLAQVVTAIQIVLEEHFVTSKDICPLYAAGLEGSFGVGIMALLLIPLYYIKVSEPVGSQPSGRLEDLTDAFLQIANNHVLAAPLVGCFITISIFIYSGIGVTKELSGTSRTVLDTVRSFFIWAVSLCFGWQTFFGLQILGFFLILVGLLTYLDVLLPFLVRKTWEAIKNRAPIKEESQVDQLGQGKS